MNTRIATLPYISAVKAKATDFTRAEVIIFLATLVLAVVTLSVLFFSAQSLRLDEAQSLWQTSRSPAAMIHMVAEDVHVPLYHLILHYWQLFLGNGVFTARMLSLTFFVLLIPAIYMVGERLYSKNVGLFAALLVTISPFLNWYGNEIRMYSLFALMTILNQYFFSRIFTDRVKRGDVSGGVWVGYILTLIVGMFTHYFFAFNAIAQAAFYFIYKKHFPKSALKMFIMIGILVIVVFAPWIYYVINLGSASNTQPALAEPTSVDLFNTFSQFVFGFQNDHTNTILVSLWPIAVLLVFLSLRRNQKVSPATMYLFFSLVIPILLAFAISMSIRPIYLTRYLILTLPSLYLLISWILSTYPERLSRVLKTLLIIIMVSTLAVEIVNANTPVKENYRAASEYLSVHATPQDVIVLSAPFTVYPFEYYYQGPVEVQTLPVWNRFVVGSIPEFSREQLERDAKIVQDSHQILWLLLSYDQGYEEEVRLYFDTHFARIDEQKFSPGLNLYAYKLRYDTLSLDEVLSDLAKQGPAKRGVNAVTPAPATPKPNPAPEPDPVTAPAPAPEPEPEPEPEPIAESEPQTITEPSPVNEPARPVATTTAPGTTTIQIIDPNVLPPGTIIATSTPVPVPELIPESELVPEPVQAKADKKVKKND